MFMHEYVTLICTVEPGRVRERERKREAERYLTKAGSLTGNPHSL